jgi:transposase
MATLIRRTLRRTWAPIFSSLSRMVPQDAADADACCETVRRPGMRFVPVKHEQQQSLLMLHRIRDRLIAERTGTINAHGRVRDSRGPTRRRPEGLDRHHSRR